ncbi:ATP-binding protein [Listeria monocytogenes]|nr:ATP-binding protein [Listeria monocytogenes]
MQITRGKIAKAQKVVFYGPEGIGKTTFASQFPNPLFIDTEGSTSNMDVARLEKPSSWTMLLQQIDFVKLNKPCETLVIDTIDWAERLAIEFVCSRGNKDSITKFGYGEGYIQLEEEFGKFLNRLTDLTEVGIHVVLLAHAKINKFEQPDEMGAYDRYELKLGNKTTAKTAALTKEWADMVLFANYKTVSVATDDKGKKFKAQGGKRVIYTTHHPAWDAKNRFGFPEEIDLDYKKIASVFIQSSTPIAPTEPTPEPVPEVPQLPHEQEEQVPESHLIGVPQSLADLMTQNNVTVQEIQQVVASKGYYPADTPIENYDANFISGVLVGAWPKVFEQIQSTRKGV